MTTQEIFKNVKDASYTLTFLDDSKRNEILQTVADSIIDNKEKLLEAMNQ